MQKQSHLFYQTGMSFPSGAGKGQQGNLEAVTHLEVSCVNSLEHVSYIISISLDLS